PADGQAEHFDALGERRQLRFRFVRRSGGGYEQDLIEPALFPALLRQDQMAQVNRIEGAAEDTDAHGLSPGGAGGGWRIEDGGSRTENTIHRFTLIDQPRFLHPRSSILDPPSSILDPRSSILDPPSSILDPRSSILDPHFFAVTSTSVSRRKPAACSGGT